MRSHLVSLFLLGLSFTSYGQNVKVKAADGSECATLPCVVASVTLTDQSAGASGVPFYTPASTGIFRISAYINTSTGTVQRAYWRLDLGWTDSGGPRSGSSISQYLASGQNGFDSATLIANDVGGQPLTYTATPHGGGQGMGGMTYTLVLIVEQIQ